MNFSKYAKYYAVATQGIISIIALLLLGYFIGYKIDPSSIWSGVLASIGGICGLISFIVTLLKVLKEEEKKKSESEKSKD